MEQKHSDQRWAEQVRTLGEAQVTVTRHWESKQQPWASGTCSECSNTALGHAHGGLFHRAVDPIEHTLIGWRGVSNNTIALRWCYKCFYSHVYIGGCKMWTISNQKNRIMQYIYSLRKSFNIELYRQRKREMENRDTMGRGERKRWLK